MYDIFFSLGFAFIAVAVTLGIAYFKPERTPKLSNKGCSAGNSRQISKSDSQTPFFAHPENYELNLDAFDDPDLCVPNQNREINQVDRAISLIRIDDDDNLNDRLKDDSASSVPSMTLASLMDIQRAEEDKQDSSKPRILGDSARELGMRYFRYLLSHHVIPRGAAHLTSEANILVAENALRNSRQSVTMSHGAVAQNIGERVVCLFEPLENPVSNIIKAVEGLKDVFKDKTVFIIMANTANVDDDLLDHLAPICKEFNVSKKCLFIEQNNHSFINYIEDVNDFVPERINVDKMPQDFFSKILDYAYDAYDEGDHEAVIRTIDPLLQPLYIRIRNKHNFPKILLAQALNLMGMTHRDVSQDEQAIACFNLSLTLLREIEDYDAIKSVMANLGITLALSKPVNIKKLDLAIRHLSEVTQLNPRDDEAWLYLANSFLEKYRLTNATSLLNRSLRAYEKAYALAPTQEIHSCMDALKRQIGGRIATSSENNGLTPVSVGLSREKNSGSASA